MYRNKENLKEARKLWKELSQVPVDNDGNIEKKWNIFEKGTDQFSIWLWFEEQFDVSVVMDLMESQTL